MVKRVLLQHLSVVYSMARKKADILGLSIVHVSITHPNFLCDGEESDDFRRWVNLYRELVHTVCGGDIRILRIS